MNTKIETDGYYRALAKKQQQDKDLENSLVNYYRAIELNPKQPQWVYKSLGEILNQQQREEEEKQLYQTGNSVSASRMTFYIEFWLNP